MTSLARCLVSTNVIESPRSGVATENAPGVSLARRQNGVALGGRGLTDDRTALSQNHGLPGVVDAEVGAGPDWEKLRRNNQWSFCLSARSKITARICLSTRTIFSFGASVRRLPGTVRIDHKFRSDSGWSPVILTPAPTLRFSMRISLYLELSPKPRTGDPPSRTA
jgi:hypothetical protein